MTDDKIRARRAMLVRQIVENFDPIAITQLWSVMAQEHRIKYQAYLKAGFTEEQALILCKG